MKGKRRAVGLLLATQEAEAPENTDVGTDATERALAH